MKSIIILLLFLVFLGCSKQDKTSNQNADSVKNGGSTTAGDVKQTSQTTSQPVKTKTYTKGEPIELYDLVFSMLPNKSDEKTYIEWAALDNIGFVIFDKQLYQNESKDGKLVDKLILKSKKSNDKYISSDCFITLSGNQNGYSKIHIGVSCAKCFHDSEDNDYTINTVFNGFEHKVTQFSINSYTEGYELIMPGKQTVYCIIKRSQCGGRNHWADDFLFDIFLDKNDLIKQHNR